jgi:hypothetical protein
MFDLIWIIKNECVFLQKNFKSKFIMIFDLSSIPKGSSKEDKKQRKIFIKAFYRHWAEENTSKKVFNKALNDFIHVKFISVDETSGQASHRYKSAVAITFLSEILENAVPLGKEIESNLSKENQKGFEKIRIVEYNKANFGKIKLVIGIKRSTKEKVQYCVTAIKNG